jgi:zinc protease
MASVTDRQSKSMVQTPVKSVSGPICHRLSNGLTIVAEQVPVEAVSFGLWVEAGSAVEPDAINGMAHFLEHMVFKGSPRLPGGEFERRVEQRGGNTNAATGQDYTHYHVTVAPSDFAAIAPDQIELVLNASLEADDFERERLVVLEEIRRAQDNPRQRIFQQFIQLAYAELPYRRPVLGPAEVVAQLSPQQMQQHHQQWYQPPTMTAVAVGNLPVEQLMATIEAGFAGVPTYPLLDLPTWEPEPPFQTIVREHQLDPTLQQARLVMFWRVPGMANLEQTYALDVLARILGSGRTSRLVKDLREERGLVSGISVSNMTQALQGIFSISAQLPIENLPIVEAAIAQQIETLRQEIVQPQELAQVRTQTANQFIFRNETPDNRASLYGYYQAIAGDLNLALNYPDQIQAITAETIQTAAQTYLNPAAYGIFTCHQPL